MGDADREAWSQQIFDAQKTMQSATNVALDRVRLPLPHLRASPAVRSLSSIAADRDHEHSSIACLARLKSIAEPAAAQFEGQPIRVRLVVQGPAAPFFVTDATATGPDLMLFEGRKDDGHPIWTIQRQEQRNVSLVAVQEQSADKETTTGSGFHVWMDPELDNSKETGPPKETE